MVFSAAGTFSLKRWAKLETNTPPTNADPTALPIWRKKLLAAVAVPTIVIGKEFWTMSTRICIAAPKPKPNTNKHIPTWTRLELASS